MYVPEHFRIEDAATITSIIREHNFGVLVTAGVGGIRATHLPFIYDPDAGESGSLRGHISGANPQGEHFAGGGDALAIFSGPHTYVSPTWYVDHPKVPTWDYVAVQVAGKLHPLTGDDRVEPLLADLVAEHETGDGAWTMADEAELSKRLLSLVSGFEIEITGIDAIAKLSQNQSEANRDAIVAGLKATSNSGSAAIAALIGKGFAASADT